MLLFPFMWVLIPFVALWLLILCGCVLLLPFPRKRRLALGLFLTSSLALIGAIFGLVFSLALPAKNWIDGSVLATTAFLVVHFAAVIGGAILGAGLGRRLSMAKTSLPPPLID